VDDLSLDLPLIPDEATRTAVVALKNLVERLAAENLALRQENQHLKDEIQRLQGEQGKPTFRPQRKPPASKAPAPDLSSEEERRQPKPWSKSPKLDRIVIHRRRICRLDRSLLPPDAQFKGYAPVVVQDLIFRTLNTCFLQEVFYSPAIGQSYQAELPPGYTGSYGPTVHALALTLAYDTLVSQPQIHHLFGDVGLLISAGEVCELLVADREAFRKEKEQVGLAGLASSPWQQMDVTETRVNGQTDACHILCNPLYTFYETTASKERLCALDVLRLGGRRTYRLGEGAFAYLEAVGVAQWLTGALKAAWAGEAAGQEWDEVAFEAWLSTHLSRAGPQQRQRVREAAALWAYEADPAIPKVETLVCDDAPQFRLLTKRIALCWVHEGRHYKKLCPYLPEHQHLLAAFRKEFWEYYRKLRAYQEAPREEEGARLSLEFDTLFARRTGYVLLDERIEKTAAKKAELLVVLEHPEVPLHNNESELGARRRVRKRDVSFGPRSEGGKRAWDTFQTLSATAKKLGISFYHYLHDRISGAKQTPSLAEGIEERARVLNLGASWETA
jgi:hypothetical protein